MLTRGLDGQGIESRWGARFSSPVQIDPGANPASYTMRKDKVKVKFTLEQATEAQKGRKGITLLFP
jgi:hypothetical protein